MSTRESEDRFIGIDVGTSGLRVVAVTDEGRCVAAASRPIYSHRSPDQVTHEQDPSEWWRSACEALREITWSGGNAGERFRAVAVTSTSGSLVAADEAGRVLRPAILYDDERARVVAMRFAAEAPWLNASCSLARALWLREHEPSVWESSRWILHPTDWMTGMLTGRFGACDHSNALKLGFEAANDRWCELARRELAERLPEVQRSGTVAGAVREEAECKTSLPDGTVVVAGATDGMAGLIASGACEAGDANTTLGSTLVWKVLSNRPYATQGIYSHLHPAGLWACGAASNTGPGSLPSQTGNGGMIERDAAAEARLPTEALAYSLPGRGERFPFSRADACSFLEPCAGGETEEFAARLQSLAFVERWGYERLAASGVDIGAYVYSTGAASASPALARLRASVLGRSVVRCASPSAAHGAAILAASAIRYGGDVARAIRSMTSIQQTFEPVAELRSRYDELYGRFRAACRRREYDS